VLDAAGGGPSGTREQELASIADDPVLFEVVRRLVKEFHPQRVYLFGSRARGDVRVDSDYDVMLVVEERAGAPGTWSGAPTTSPIGVAHLEGCRSHDERPFRLDARGRRFIAVYGQARGSPVVCSVKTRVRTSRGIGFLKRWRMEDVMLAEHHLGEPSLPGGAASEAKQATERHSKGLHLA
jgi:Nucleotidyltransferase domain